MRCTTPPPSRTDSAALLFTLRSRFTGRNVLCQPRTARTLLAAAYHCHAVGDWHCHLFLLLPDQVHAIAALPAGVDAADWLRSFKLYATRHTGVVWHRHGDHEALLDETYALAARLAGMPPLQLAVIKRQLDDGCIHDES